NDQIAPILGYGDLVQGAITIKRVYYVEGLNHNLFSVGQLCDADLEVAFRKSTFYIRDLKGNDLLTCSRGMNLYSITLQDTNCPNPICLMAKATSSQAWLRHRRLSHLNFDTINLLSKNYIVVGLPKLKFVKDHLCSSCELGKAKRKDGENLDKMKEKDKTVTTSNELDLLFSPMFDELLNGSSMVVSNSSAVSAADAPNQRYHHITPLYNHSTTAPTCQIPSLAPTVSSSENLNQTGSYAENDQVADDEFINIFCTPEGVDFEESFAPVARLEAVRDGENLDKMKEKCDECIFVEYSTQSRAYRVYNKRTKVIVETIHVNFDELPHMASDHPSAVNATDAPDKRQQHNISQSSTTTVAANAPPLNIQTTPETITQALIVTATENINQDFFESNDKFSSIDDDSFSFDKIDYVEASPPDSELVRSEVMEIVIPKIGRIDDDILREKLLNVNHLFAKLEASNDNPIPFYDPIISGTPLTLTPSGESDFFLEVDAFLAVEDEPISSQFPKSYLDPERDILLLEAFLNDDHSSDFKTKSSSTSLNSLLEETNNFDNSLPEFTTFLNVLYDAEYESDSSDDQSCSDKDVLEKIILKPLFKEEIIPIKIDLHPDNAESDLLESLRTHDYSLLISSKIDSLLDEFAGELTLLKSIPPGIDETDCDFEGDIRLIEKLLYDNSSPRPPEEFVSEINLFCTPDYPMPPGIEDDDYDSERDILILKDLPSNNTLSFAEKESFHFDIPLFSRPLADTGILNIKMMGDISDQKAFMHELMITLASHQEKSPDLLSHQGHKAF
nr:retrovirus-related Pol polyprotein from transposon TNT 1-94 [Tanacetum cinerariifolium]